MFPVFISRGENRREGDNRNTTINKNLGFDFEFKLVPGLPVLAVWMLAI